MKDDLITTAVYLFFGFLALVIIVGGSMSAKKDFAKENECEIYKNLTLNELPAKCIEVYN